ncbi:type I methionyl aminopeptidase [Ornithinimicrobium humiphilum]|uniref:Methionine aminopeptidase n=1 Tax=Ornithinimicrobium humiphilum TaxID=125288 RepID=A0A543KNR2_9MICO|nr:type I methionyl aminopeptidase [Ornithinimicrobium humiphilum]TQM96716.1 methionyl aminopeptidase [Ornithinimicrobium humiphilum]
MIEILSPSEVEAARPAGRFVGETLRHLRERTRVGTNLLEIDEWAAQRIEDVGAVSCYVDYAPSFGSGPFGHVICTSVNDAVLHGLPHDYALRAGDLLTLDFAVSIDGWVADAAITFSVGQPATPDEQRMIDASEKALAAAISRARAGNRVGDLSHAIGKTLKRAGFRVNTQFGGHGVGSTMHQDPHIANDGRPGKGTVLRPGMLLAIEPWVMADTDELVVDDDGWTLRSATGARTCHVEHTVAITSGDPIVLTRVD